MKFISLELNNWLVFRGKQSINFPQDDHSNILIIFGENMHGKTSLLNAVRWALYGEALDRQKKAISNEKLMNLDAFNNGDSEFSVKLVIKADGSVFEVDRRSSIKAGVVQSSVTLKLDNRVQDGSSVQMIINGLVAKQISQFLLFDGELLNQFEELVVNEGSEQANLIKNSIERALGLPVLQRAASEISILSKTLSRSVQEEIKKDNNIKVLIRNLEVHNNNLESKEKEKQTLDEELEEHRAKITDLDAELTKSSQNIGLSERRKILDAEITSNKSEITDTKAEIKMLMSALWREPLSKALEPCVTKIRDDINYLSGVQNAKAVTLSKIREHEKSIFKSECSECGYALGAEEKSKIQLKIDQLSSEVSADGNLEDQIAKLQQRLGGLASLEKVKPVSSKVSELAKTSQKLILRNAKIENEIFDIRNQLAGFDEEKGRRIKSEYDRRNKEIGRVLQQIAIVEGEISDFQFEIDAIKKHPDFKGALTKGKTNDQYVIAESLKAVFGSAIDRYRDAMRKKVGSRASSTFKNLTTEKSFDELRINGSYGLDLIIDGNQVARSAGAEQIVALSLIEALNHHGRRKGPMLMDTPAGRLDKSHRKNVMNYLPQVVTQLAIFAHSGELTDDEIYFDRSRIGGKYKIRRVSSFHSVLEEA